MDDCLFCKILAGKIPAKKVFENEEVLGFVDIYPMAKEHYLFIHKDHTDNVNEMALKNPIAIGNVFKSISEFSISSGLEMDGYRIVTNIGPNGGQSVFHTHFHVLGGEKLGRFGS